MSSRHLCFNKLFERNNVSKCSENHWDDTWDVKNLLVKVSNYLKVIVLYYSTSEQCWNIWCGTFFHARTYFKSLHWVVYLTPIPNLYTGLPIWHLFQIFTLGCLSDTYSKSLPTPIPNLYTTAAMLSNVGFPQHAWRAKLPSPQKNLVFHTVVVSPRIDQSHPPPLMKLSPHHITFSKGSLGNSRHLILKGFPLLYDKVKPPRVPPWRR
jgi:hypothetical protein